MYFSYLLDEMSAEERDLFESELSDPKLADALLQESVLLTQIAEAKISTSSPSLSYRNDSTARIVLVVLAVAAGLLIVLGIRAMQPQPQSEGQVAASGAANEFNGDAMELQIAQAWAEQSLSGSNFQDELLVEPIDPISTEGTAESETELDSVDWMVVAVQASLSGENDG